MLNLVWLLLKDKVLIFLEIIGELLWVSLKKMNGVVLVNMVKEL